MTKEEILKDLYDYTYEHLERWGTGMIVTHSTGYTLFTHLCGIIEKEGLSHIIKHKSEEWQTGKQAV